MRRIISYISIISILYICVICNTKEIHAKELNNPKAVIEEDKIVPYADEIIFKYRTYNGVYQYRRWNVTKNVG